MNVAKSIFGVSQLQLKDPELPASLDELIKFWNEGHKLIGELEAVTNIQKSTEVIKEEIKDVKRPKKTRKSVSK